MKKKDAEWFIYILIAFAIFLAISFFIKPMVVCESSMEPNYHSGEFLIVSKQSYSLFGGEIERGDVIVFSDDTGKYLIKRVIGLPGDGLSIQEGYIYINGEKLFEPYLLEQGVSGDADIYIIEENKYYCCGDNRAASRDSRAFGSIDKSKVLGKVVIEFN